MADAAAEQRFPIRLAQHHRLHLALRGMIAGHAFMALASDHLTVRAGSWYLDVTLAEVISADVVEPEDGSIGVHHHRHGRWSIAGDTGRAVLRLKLDQSTTCRIPAVAVLDIGLEAPHECLDQLLALRPDLERRQ